MRTLILSAIAVLTAPGLLQAQVVAGSYELFGSSCAAGGGTTCVSHNPNGGTVTANNLQNEYGYPFNVTSTLVVSGFDLFLSSKGGLKTVPAFLYKATSGGAPEATPLASTTITVNTTGAFYRASFEKLQILNAGKYFISAWCIENPFKNPLSPSAVNPSQLTSGSTLTGIYWRRGTPNWATTTLITMPSFKIICGGSVKPTLAAPGVPEIGKVFTMYLHGKSASPVIFAIGTSNTKWGALNLPLPAPNAPGCHIFSSLDIQLPGVTNSNGLASLPLPIPNQKTLIGISFFTQSALNDAKANSLGWLFTNSAKASIGGLR